MPSAGWSFIGMSLRDAEDLETITGNIVDEIGTLNFDILYGKCPSHAE